MPLSKWIYYSVLIFLGLIAVLLIVSVLPISGNFKIMTVLSGSMEPEIKTGSIIAAKPSSEYKIGDIITFNPVAAGKTPITHRIIEITVEQGNPIYTTKGDANNAPDTRKIKNSDIIGKMVFSVPYIGFAVDFARKPLGFLLIVGIPAGAIIGDEIRKIVKELKNKNNA